MLSDMFGRFSWGRIGRLRFVGLTLLLGAMFVAVGMLLGVFAGVADRLDPARTVTNAALPALGFAAWLVLAVAGIAVTVGMLNLVAKRARDIGWSVPLLVILYLFFSGIVWFVMALVPGRTDIELG